MEEKGIFRSALGGFNKKDVLEYIDRITAGWNEERQQLTEQARTDRDAADQAREEALAAAEAVEQVKQQAEAEVREAQQTAEELQARLTQALEECRQAQAQIAALQAEAAKKEESRSVAIAEMMAAEERLRTREQELADRDARLTELKEQQSRYRALLGDCDTMQENVTAAVRPFIRTVGEQADSTLDAVGQALTALTAQMAELQDSIDSRRQALKQAQAESEQQLDDTSAQWLESARRLSCSGQSDSHFFR